MPISLIASVDGFSPDDGARDDINTREINTTNARLIVACLIYQQTAFGVAFDDSFSNVYVGGPGVRQFHGDIGTGIQFYYCLNPVAGPHHRFRAHNSAFPFDPLLMVMAFGGQPFAFDKSNATAPFNGAKRPGGFEDLVIDATSSNKVTSVLSPFTSAHVGRTLRLASGTGFTPGSYSILSVVGAAAVLDRSIGTVNSIHGIGDVPLTPAEDGELFIAGIGSGANPKAASLTINDGFTRQFFRDFRNDAFIGDPANVNRMGGAAGYKIQTSAATEDPTWTSIPDMYASLAMLCFKRGVEPTTSSYAFA